MANRDFKDVQALAREIKLIAGRIDLTDKDNPAIASVTVNGQSVNDGLGFSVSKEGTGLYRITLEDKYNGVLLAGANFTNNGTTARVCQVKSHTVTTTKLVDIETLNGSLAAADPANNSEITFMLALRNSTAL